MQLKTTDKHFNDISTVRQTQQQCSTIKWLSSPLAWYQTLQSWSFSAWCRNKFLSWESWYTCRFHPHLTRRRNANVYKGYCTTTINEREGASCHCWRLRRVDKKIWQLLLRAERVQGLVIREAITIVLQNLTSHNPFF